MLKVDGFNTQDRIKNNKNVSFTSASPCISGLGTKVLDSFIKSQENLSSTRFIQDTATNWFPKAVFSRSKEDFAEMSFLEFLESGIFYFAPPLIGENLFRKGIFKQIQEKPIREKVEELIPKSIEQIKNDKTLPEKIKNSAVATKAGIVLACAAIPVAEYNLSFAKNLFTLKTFKKADFNNIANLGKGNKESKEHQDFVEQHSKQQLRKGLVYSAAALLGGIALAKAGKNSKTLQNFSQTLLEPGKKISKALKLEEKAKCVDAKKAQFAENADSFLKNYLKFDFDEENGKLALSKGQLALTAISGLFGYSKAAKDRGELDRKEVWTRVPLVVFYTIFGSSLFDLGFKKLLAKKGKFPDLIQKTDKGKIKDVPKRTDLPGLAESISKKSGKTAQEELKRLTKEKAVITGVPYIFSLIAMGFSLSLITRLWTQYRYNKTHQDGKSPINFTTSHNIFKQSIDNNAFSAFM